jgi:GNAT superfamily N-acetyltransferase
LPSSVPEATEIARAAWRDLWAAVPRQLAARYGIAAAEVGGATCTVVRAADAGLSMLNRTIGLGAGAPATEQALDETAAWFDAHGAEQYVSLLPESRPPELRGWLAARGFEEAWAWTWFTRRPDAADEPQARVRVAQVGAEQADVFGEIVAGAFGFPDWIGAWLAALPGRECWQAFLAADGEEPAGAAATFMHGDAAYLSFGAVRPEHRGKGAQRALLAARVHAAADAGCRLITTETGEQVVGKPDYSHRNILGAGFEPHHRIENWRRPRAVA